MAVSRVSSGAGHEFGNFRQGTKSAATSTRTRTPTATDDGAGTANWSGWTIRVYNDNDGPAR